MKMTGSGSLHDGYLVIHRDIGPHDQVVFGDVFQSLGIRQGNPLQHFRYELARIVDKLFHLGSPFVTYA